MKKLILILLPAMMLAFAFAYAEVPDTLWTQHGYDTYPGFRNMTDLQFTPDGNRIVAASILTSDDTYQGITILNAQTGQILKEMKITLSMNSLVKFVISYDGRYLYTLPAYTSDAILIKWDMETYQPLDTIIINIKSDYIIYNIVDLALSHDGNIIAVDYTGGNVTIGYDNTISTYSTVSGDMIKEISYTGARKYLKASPVNNNLVVVGGYNIEVFDITTLTKIKDLASLNSDLPRGFEYSRFSRSGNLLGVYNTFTGKNHIYNMNQLAFKDSIFLKGLSCLYFDFFSDESKMAYVGHTNECHLIDITNPYNIKELYHYPYPAFVYVSFSPDFKYIAGWGGVDVTIPPCVLLFNNKLNTISVPDEKQMETTLFPNPSNSIVNIEFNNSKYDYFEIKITDIQSKIIKELFKGNLEIGNQRFEWSAKGIPDGIYFCTISSIHFNKTFKIIIQK